MSTVPGGPLGGGAGPCKDSRRGTLLTPLNLGGPFWCPRSACLKYGWMEVLQSAVGVDSVIGYILPKQKRIIRRVRTVSIVVPSSLRSAPTGFLGPPPPRREAGSPGIPWLTASGLQLPLPCGRRAGSPLGTTKEVLGSTRILGSRISRLSLLLY